MPRATDGREVVEEVGATCPRTSGQTPSPPPKPARAKGELEDWLQNLVDADRPFAPQKEELTEAFTKAYLQVLLEKTGGNQSEAARIAGLNRSYLGRMLVKLGINKGS